MEDENDSGDGELGLYGGNYLCIKRGDYKLWNVEWYGIEFGIVSYLASTFVSMRSMVV